MILHIIGLEVGGNYKTKVRLIINNNAPEPTPKMVGKLTPVTGRGGVVGAGVDTTDGALGVTV